MFKATIFLILGILLVVLGVVFIFKNFLTKYKMSSNSFTTLLILIIIIAELFSSLIIVINSLTLQNTILYLRSPNIPKDEFDSLTKSIPLIINQIIKCLGIGYGSYIIDLVLVKVIQKQKQSEVNNNSTTRWNLK